MAGAADITALYTAVHGTPIVGTKIFLTAALMIDGFEDAPAMFTAVVPVAA